jgi:D-threo-aldose 1-dehydrogenase
MDPMQTVPLGRTRLRVTRLGLGTAPLGGLFQPVDEAEAERVVERAYELGIRLFDTAPLYGYGRAEERLGRVLRRLPRDSFVLASKVGRLLREDAPPDLSQVVDGEPIYKGTPEGVNPVFDFSSDGVRRSHEESLRRLGLERIDILHLHDPDDHFDQALGEGYPALDELRRQGRIHAAGAGMNQPEMPARFARAAGFDCFLLAGRYTLLDQSGLGELLPLCEQKGISIIAGGVFNSGVLADPRPGATYAYTPAPPEVLQRARRLQEVCAAHDVPLAAAAIQFPLGHPAVASVVVGARSVRELEEDVALFRHPIPGALWDDLKANGLLPPEAPVPYDPN